MRYMELVGVVGFSVAVASCASSGNKISQSQIDQIKIGETTFNQMVEIFGSPVGQGYGSEGHLTANWMYVYVGPFGSGMEQQVLAVYFDDKDKVQKYNLLNQAPNGPRLGR